MPGAGVIKVERAEGDFARKCDRAIGGDRAGFGSAALRRANPRLITMDSSGYGDTPAYQDMKAYDLLVQAESGLASITGHPAGPGRVGVSIG